LQNKTFLLFETPDKTHREFLFHYIPTTIIFVDFCKKIVYIKLNRLQKDEQQ